MTMVNDRALASAITILLTVGNSPISVELLAEYIRYCPRHTARIISTLENQRAIERRGGRRGVPYHYQVNKERAMELGFLSEGAAHAA